MRIWENGVPVGMKSHAQVVDRPALLNAPGHRHLFAGLLCTIELTSDPLETYDSLEPPAVDFLLPHGNWRTPPPSRNSDFDTASYGEWLIDVFERWYAR
jgi:uncharacterized protein